MKNLPALLLIVCLSFSGFARENPTFFLRPVAFVYSMPLGNFSAKGNSSFLPGRAQRGDGVEGSIMRGWNNGWTVGLDYQVVTYRNDSATTNKWIYDNYHRDGYYTEITNFHVRSSITCLSVSLLKEFDLKALSLAPTLNVGLGIFGEVKEINVH